MYRNKIEGYKYYFSKMSYESDVLDIALEPRYTYYNSKVYWGLNSKLTIGFDIFNTDTQIIPYLLSLDKSFFASIYGSGRYISSSSLG